MSLRSLGGPRRRVRKRLVIAPDARLVEAAHNVLDAPLAVVWCTDAGGALALLDRVRAFLEVLEAALVHLALGVGAQRGVRLVVLGALDAVLWSARLGEGVSPWGECAQSLSRHGHLYTASGGRPPSIAEATIDARSPTRPSNASAAATGSVAPPCGMAHAVITAMRRASEVNGLPCCSRPITASMPICTALAGLAHPSPLRPAWRLYQGCASDM